MYLNTRFEGIGTQGKSWWVPKELYPNKRIWGFKRPSAASLYIPQEVQYPYNLSLTRPEIVTSNESSKLKRPKRLNQLRRVLDYENLPLTPLERRRLRPRHIAD